MEKSIIVRVMGIGLVLFEHSNRAKRIGISVKPFKRVRVAIPYNSSFHEAMEFVNTKTGWIKRQLEKMQEYEKQHQLNVALAEDIDREKAINKLTSRLNELANKYGFSYNCVFIRNQKTRWGSCSSKNNIYLNMKLVKLPDELIDYVLLHELVHTRKKDHSQAFWAELDKIVGNGKKMALKLRKYKLALI